MIFMNNLTVGSVLAALLATVDAAAVRGKPEGFGSKASGGVAGPTVTPSTNAQLQQYLSQSGPLNIIVTKTFDFRGTEGTVTEKGCAPYGTGAACQKAINAGNWCATDQPSAPTATVTYDKAATIPLMVSSDKTVLGIGKVGVIRGKGLRIAGGTNNVILQNLEITDLNPQYVWGGDAITLDGSSNVWIDHVKTSLVGRQHIVAGNGKNTGITISNHYINGVTSWSANCDTYHYWGLYLTGPGDTITLENNYIYHTSGRSPKLGGGSVLHFVNNLWSDNTGHAFEGGAAYALLEGNYFRNVRATVEKYTGYFWAPTASDSSCQATLGRNCVANMYENSPTIVNNNNQPIAKVGQNAATALQATTVGNLANTAGNTL